MNVSLIHGMFGSIGMYLFVGLVLFLFIVFITRELACWYFKINRINTLLERIEENTRPKGLIRKPLDESED